MFERIKQLLGLSPAVDYKKLVSEGAQIVDVRSEGEYEEGHIENSLNIPLPSLSTRMSKLDRRKPVITCCASGIRSAAARKLLERNGFRQVYNGGGWKSLLRKL